MPDLWSVPMTVEELEATAIALELHRLRRGEHAPADEATASRWRAAEALELRVARMAERARGRGAVVPRNELIFERSGSPASGGDHADS